MFKKIICSFYICAITLCLLVFSSQPAKATTISLVPTIGSVQVGNPVDVALTISGLGNLTSPSLGIFDLDVTFDSTLLSLNSVVYGDPVLGDQLDIFSLGSIIDTIAGIGSVNLYELSFDFPEDLNALQADSFTLATLTFDTILAGTSFLDIGVNVLGDAYGDPIFADIQNSSVDVTSVSAVPEPSTLLLFVLGLAGLLLWKKRGQTI